MIKYLKQWYWHRRLQKLVRKQLASYETQDFIKRRKAALKREPRIWA